MMTLSQLLSGTMLLLTSLEKVMNQSIVGDITSSCISNIFVNILQGEFFLHIIFFQIQLIRKYNSKFCLHLACLAFDKDYRGKDNIGTHIIGIIAIRKWKHRIIFFLENILHQVMDQGGVCTTVSNFRPFCKSLYSVFPGCVNLEDSVHYKDINLVVNNQNPFDTLAHLGEIKYYSLKR